MEANTMMGIYELRFVRPDGSQMIYYGRAQDLDKRVHKQHIPQLRKGTHANWKLQRDFKRYGEAALFVRYVETAVYASDEQLKDMEARYIGFNRWGDSNGPDAQEYLDAGWTLAECANIGDADDGGAAPRRNTAGTLVRDGKPRASQYKGVYFDGACN